MKDHSKH
jgi:hypothetical protein